MNELKKQLITSKESELLTIEYDNSNYAAINAKRPNKKPDSKFYIYDLEILQEYINLAREGMEELGIKNKGIRVSLGKYPDEGFGDRLNPLFKGYQTIFFSPENLDLRMEGKGSNDETGLEGIPNLDYGQICPPW